jgi:Mn-dependent DtxR family transcriptional regulator
MNYGYCGGCCEPTELSKADRKAKLKELEVILGAKLATVKQMMENLDKEEKE